MDETKRRKINFGRILKNKLQERRMRQIDLARKIDVTDTTISRYVNGDVKPKPLLLNRIANVLDCSPDELFEDF